MTPDAAYRAALKLLAGRELSEAQIRQRLLRRGFSSDAVADAVERLRQGGALDDERTAAMIARKEASVRHRGAVRARRAVEQAGISAAVARKVVGEIFSAIDSTALLEQALVKRLHGRTQFANLEELGRVQRYLIGQGFEPAAVRAALRARGNFPNDDDGQ